MSIRRHNPMLRTSVMLAATCTALFAGNCFAQAGAGTPAGYIHDYPTPTTVPWQLPNVPSNQAKPSGEGNDEAMGGAVKGALAGLDQAGKAADMASKAMDFQKTLNSSDDRLKPDYTPPGAPSVPSKCMENAACRPCYTEAYAKVNKTRKALEKVRAHYDFTHKFSTEGIALMTSVAATAGGPAGIGAAVESRKVNAAVSDFDTVVRNKNVELLTRLQGELMEVNTCEAKYYGNTDWYDRFGYMYFQFMSAHYGYAAEHLK